MSMLLYTYSSCSFALSSPGQKKSFFSHVLLCDADAVVHTVKINFMINHKWIEATVELLSSTADADAAFIYSHVESVKMDFKLCHFYRSRTFCTI